MKVMVDGVEFVSKDAQRMPGGKMTKDEYISELVKIVEQQDALIKDIGSCFNLEKLVSIDLKKTQLNLK